MLLALRNVAGLAGIFLTLLGIGFGLVLLGKPNLEIISDTVSHTFGRSFAVGLLAQVLAIPTFGVLILGLILSVIGILLVPFAVVASVLAAAGGGAGGRGSRWRTRSGRPTPGAGWRRASCSARPTATATC